MPSARVAFGLSTRGGGRTTLRCRHVLWNYAKRATRALYEETQNESGRKRQRDEVQSKAVATTTTTTPNNELLLKQIYTNVNFFLPHSHIHTQPNTRASLLSRVPCSTYTCDVIMHTHTRTYEYMYVCRFVNLFDTLQPHPPSHLTYRYRL